MELKVIGAIVMGVMTLSLALVMLWQETKEWLRGE